MWECIIAAVLLFFSARKSLAPEDVCHLSLFLISHLAFWNSLQLVTYTGVQLLQSTSFARELSCVLNEENLQDELCSLSGGVNEFLNIARLLYIDQEVSDEQVEYSKSIKFHI